MRTLSRRRPAFPVVAMLWTMLCAAAAHADEYARIGNVDILAARSDGAVRTAPARGLLTMPATWRPGDVAVVLLADPADGQQGWRDRLVSDLVNNLVAVLELVLPVEQEERLPVLFGALLELAQQAQAGQVLALGTGAAGEAVLAAAAPDVAERHAGAGGPRFAMLAALRPGCHADRDMLRGEPYPPVGLAFVVSLRPGEADCRHRVVQGHDARR